MTWKQWFHGLLAALIGSFGTLSVTGIAGQAEGYDIFTLEFWKPCLYAAIFNGYVSARMYIAKFPPPGTLTDIIVTQTDSVRKIPGGATTTTATTKTETTERPETPVVPPA